jgi:hypothetical protein
MIHRRPYPTATRVRPGSAVWQALPADNAGDVWVDRPYLASLREVLAFQGAHRGADRRPAHLDVQQLPNDRQAIAGAAPPNRRPPHTVRRRGPLPTSSSASPDVHARTPSCVLPSPTAPARHGEANADVNRRECSATDRAELVCVKGVRRNRHVEPVPLFGRRCGFPARAGLTSCRVAEAPDAVAQSRSGSLDGAMLLPLGPFPFRISGLVESFRGFGAESTASPCDAASHGAMGLEPLTPSLPWASLAVTGEFKADRAAISRQSVARLGCSFASVCARMPPWRPLAARAPSLSATGCTEGVKPTATAGGNGPRPACQ